MTQVKSTKFFMVLTFSAMAMAMGAASVALAQDSAAARWDLAKAVVTGTGCSMNSHSLAAVGNMLQINGPRIGIALGGSFGAATSARVACTVRAPVTIPAGYYLAGVESAIRATSSLKGDASGQIGLAVRASSFTLDPFNMMVPAGRRSFGVVGFGATPEAAAEMCDGDSHSIIVGGNLVVNGSREGDGYVSVRLGSGSGTSLLRLVIAQCPR